MSVQLGIAKGEWPPEADDSIGLWVYAFAEAGRPLQNPGLLIHFVVIEEPHRSRRLAANSSRYFLKIDSELFNAGNLKSSAVAALHIVEEL